MTKYYQPLDTRVNGYAKTFLATHFNEWCTAQISKQLEDGKALKEIDVKLRFSVLKLLYAEWLMSLYNELTSSFKNSFVFWKEKGLKVNKQSTNLSESKIFFTKIISTRLLKILVMDR